MTVERLHTRIIVIGSGVAGLFTAWRCAAQGPVLLMTKRTLRDSNTMWAQGGIAAALGAGDSPELHRRDTLAAGAALCDVNAVDVLVNEGPDRVRELVEAGARFDRNARGDFKLGKEAAHSRRRIVHAQGDQTGAEVSRTLIERVQSSPNVQVLETARVLDLMREPIFVGGQECFVTASVGIALYPRDGLSVVDLLRNSDMAMYSVKATGRNSSLLYRPQLAGKGREKLELESALHKAIERDELVLYYQPKVDVRAAKMVGVEALMRWRRGNILVPPGDFIPLAEETGLIIPLSEWAIREAARQARLWRDSFGFADSIAVNLPNRLFERTDLVEYIHRAVTEYGVPHSAIELEITETGLMKDLQNVIPSLHRLNEIGVEISIDDFGTGYSSLAYLTTLPISELKIDRSFVRDLGMTPQSSAVVTAIIALARALGLRVIAEGVENLRQMEVLHRLGCGVMQGFLFSKPQPPDDIEAWLQHTVLPRKAPWIGVAGISEESELLRVEPARGPRNLPVA